jgi:hypothetical protein
MIQYFIDDVHVTLYKQENERLIKMQQILTDTLNVEIQQNKISDIEIMSDIALLTSKLKNNISSHMELQWGCKIESLSIIGISHINQYRNNDLIDQNSLQIQLNRVFQIAREFRCTPEEAFKIDLIRTGRVRNNQNINVYSFPEAVPIIQSVLNMINNR